MPKFVCPNEKKRLEAIGLVKSESVPSEYQWKPVKKNQTCTFPPIKYFIPDDFRVISKPKAGDWLAEHNEPGQTFERLTTGPRTHPLPRKNVIYIQPLEFCSEHEISKDTLDTLNEYAEIFFGLPVKSKKPIKDFDGNGVLKSVTRRLNAFSNEPQANASEIMDVLKGFKPTDAFCMAGITLYDIYPQEEWNFVFGLASIEDTTGVYSLSRYMPETQERPMIIRAVRVMCHEICHMFGIKHCIYFDCLMNGSNHADEAMSRSTFLCPSCLRKLHFMVKFDIAERYQKMLQFWERISPVDRDVASVFHEHVTWLTTRSSL